MSAETKLLGKSLVGWWQGKLKTENKSGMAQIVKSESPVCHCFSCSPLSVLHITCNLIWQMMILRDQLKETERVKETERGDGSAHPNDLIIGQFRFIYGQLGQFIIIQWLTLVTLSASASRYKYIHSENNSHCLLFHLRRPFSSAVDWATDALSSELVCILSDKYRLSLGNDNANENFYDCSKVKLNGIREHSWPLK